ncbi:MAG: acylphosphatase [Methylococcaceae bacterium]|nr:acylphosphatase [Methylococcaceae bacterium]
MIRRVHVTISGRVQGVFFRAKSRERAVSLGLSGWVRNLPDGRVELLAEGPATAVAALLMWCQSGPPRARVDECRVVELTPLCDMRDFQVTG